MDILRVITDLGLVRVISLNVDPREFKSNILVQKRMTKDSEWELHERFNSFTDDSAYTNARDSAFRAVKEVALAKSQSILG